MSATLISKYNLQTKSESKKRLSSFSDFQWKVEEFLKKKNIAFTPEYRYNNFSVDFY